MYSCTKHESCTVYTFCVTFLMEWFIVAMGTLRTLMKSVCLSERIFGEKNKYLKFGDDFAESPWVY